MGEIYFSVDVETDGPCPGVNSMLSIGAVAFSETGERLGDFSSNLDLLPDAIQNPYTMAWWDTQPEAWTACRANTVPPAVAMDKFSKWVESFEGSPVFVAYPAGFDFTYVYWYLIKFIGKSPFGFSALDLKSYAMAMLGTSFRKTVKKNFPKELTAKLSVSHSHVALDDAAGQGEMFFRMKKWVEAHTKKVS